MPFSVFSFPVEAGDSHLIAVIFEQEWFRISWKESYIRGCEYVLDWYNVDYVHWDHTVTPVSSSELAKYGMVIYPLGLEVDNNLSPNEETALDYWVANGGWFVTDMYRGVSLFWLDFLGLSSSPAMAATNWNVTLSPTLYPYPSLWNNTVLLGTFCSNSTVNAAVASSLAKITQGGNTFDALVRHVKGNGITWFIGPQMNLYSGALEALPNYFFTYILNEFSEATFGKRQSFFTPLMINFQIDDLFCTDAEYSQLQNVINIAKTKNLKFTLAGVAAGIANGNKTVWNLYASNKDVLELVAHGYTHGSKGFYEFKDRSYSEVEATVSAMLHVFSSLNEGNATHLIIIPSEAVDDIGIKALSDKGYEVIAGIWLHPDFGSPWSKKITFRHNCALLRRVDVFMGGKAERTFDENFERIKRGTRCCLMWGIPITPWLHLSDFTEDYGANMIGNYTQWLSSCDPKYVHFNELIKIFFATQYKETCRNGRFTISLPNGHTSFIAKSFYDSTIEVDSTLIGENYIILNHAFEIDKVNHRIWITQKQRQNLTTITLTPWAYSTYIKQTNQRITSCNFTDCLALIIETLPGTIGTTNIYCAEGKPERVLVDGSERPEGEVWNYNTSTQLLTIWTRSSPTEIIVVMRARALHFPTSLIMLFIAFSLIAVAVAVALTRRRLHKRPKISSRT